MTQPIELMLLSNPGIPSKTLVETSENHSNIYLVGQGRCTAAAPGSIRWLATFGANPCFIVSIYDSSNRRGALAHIDDLSDPSVTLNTMQGSISYPRPDNAPKYHVYLVGGSLSKLTSMAEILEEATEMKKRSGLDIELTVGDIRQNSASLALDLLDGSLYHFIPSRLLTSFQSPSTMELQMKAYTASTEGRKRGAQMDPVIGF